MSLGQKAVVRSCTFELLQMLSKFTACEASGIIGVLMGSKLQDREASIAAELLLSIFNHHHRPRCQAELRL